MVREQFIRLKKGMIIFDPVKDEMVTVNSSFINPKDVKDEDVLICQEFFTQKKEVKILVSDYERWIQFRVDTFMDDLSQGLTNKLLLKKIIILEDKLKKISTILK